MKTINPTDTRFVHITNAKICHLFKEISPLSHYLLQISYKNDDSDVFSEYLNIIIDSTKIESELVKLHDDNKVGSKHRLMYAHGMSDIDMYLTKNEEFTIMYSPNDGIYYYITFEKIQLTDLVKKIKYAQSNK